MKVQVLFQSDHLTQEMQDRIEGDVLTMVELESARWRYRIVGTWLEYKTDKEVGQAIHAWDRMGFKFGDDYKSINFEVEQ